MLRILVYFSCSSFLNLRFLSVLVCWGFRSLERLERFIGPGFRFYSSVLAS